MDRWKLIPESITGAYMLVNKKGEYVLYTDYEELHERTCELEMKYAKKSADDFKRYKNCHEAQNEIEKMKEELTILLKLSTVNMTDDHVKRVKKLLRE